MAQLLEEEEDDVSLRKVADKPVKKKLNRGQYTHASVQEATQVCKLFLALFSIIYSAIHLEYRRKH